jgi:hypothetical protein
MQSLDDVVIAEVVLEKRLTDRQCGNKSYSSKRSAGRSNAATRSRSATLRRNDTMENVHTGQVNVEAEKRLRKWPNRHW